MHSARTMFKGYNHRFRERRLCRGNAQYEAAMAAAKAEFDQAVERGVVPRGKQNRREDRVHPRAPAPNVFFRGMRLNHKVRNTA